MKKALLFLILFPLVASAGDVAVTSVTAKQRNPWNGLVDITVTIQGAADDLPNTVCLFAAMNGATKAAIPVEHITQNGDDTGSGDVWTRKYIWEAKTDVGTVKIDDVALTVDAFIGVQLWVNGPYWATCNVGASQPEESGYYFWWGDTVGYKRNANNNGLISVKDGTGYSISSSPTYNKNNSQLQSAGYIDATGNLVAAHDAATAHLGAPWRMPTESELSALVRNCNTEWTSRNGVSGRLVKGCGAYASKSIFLPAAGSGSGYDSSLDKLGSRGDYWSSTSDWNLCITWGLDFFSGDFGRVYSNRAYGWPVRPVRGFVDYLSITADALTTHLSIDCRVAVTGVTAKQRYPWNGLVDITVTTQGSAEDAAAVQCSFAATNSATKATIPIEHITSNGDAEKTGDGWNRKFIWDAKADVGAVKIDDVTLAVDASFGVQLWKDGPYWAECNVGAKKPEEYGYYFWWGDTVGYKRNSRNDGWISVKDSTSFSFDKYYCLTYDKDDYQLKREGYIDATGNLVAAHDAATAHLGAPWRMPTGAEFSALINNCDAEWTSRNGVFGRLVKGRGAYASKSIFLPAAGFGDANSLSFVGEWGSYGSSTPYSRRIDIYLYCRWRLGFSSETFHMSDNGNSWDRAIGCSVRPVREFAK